MNIEIIGTDKEVIKAVETKLSINHEQTLNEVDELIYDIKGHCNCISTGVFVRTQEKLKRAKELLSTIEIKQVKCPVIIR